MPKMNSAILPSTADLQHGSPVSHAASLIAMTWELFTWPALMQKEKRISTAMGSLANKRQCGKAMQPETIMKHM